MHEYSFIFNLSYIKCFRVGDKTTRIQLAKRLSGIREETPQTSQSIICWCCWNSKPYPTRSGNLKISTMPSTGS